MSADDEAPLTDATKSTAEWMEILASVLAQSAVSMRDQAARLRP